MKEANRILLLCDKSQGNDAGISGCRGVSRSVTVFAREPIVLVFAQVRRKMTSVAEDFWKVYKHEWVDAKKALKIHKHDEEIIYLLMQIVRGVYEFCIGEAKQHKKRKKEELVEEYVQHKLPMSFDRNHLTPPVQKFITRCVECLYHMCTSKSPPYIYWIPKGEVIDREKFDIEGNKENHVCDWTVWPAVMSNSDSLLKKGVVIPV